MALTTERERIAHLLRRAGFGCTMAELDTAEAAGRDATVDALLAQADQPEEIALSVWKLTNQRGNLPPPAISGWWAYRMLVTQRPLVEKMTLFWHDHFGCSAEKVKGGPLLVQHVELLTQMALEDFPEILLAVSRDPTMLQFLDGRTSTRGQPNENFARELLELYTLGIGNYGERDVQEAARAFTGWTIERPSPLEYLVDPHPLPSFYFNPGRHDGGEKEVLGQRGNLTGQEVLKIVIEHPATARNISRKLWEWFAYYDPEPELVESLATSFTGSDYSVRSLLRAIFTAPQFYSDRADRALYKPPADFVIGSLRSIEVGRYLDQRLRSELQDIGEIDAMDDKLRRRVLGPLRFVGGAMANMGQRLLFPPNVSGWDGGAAWINSATMVERIKFAEAFSEQGIAQGGNAKARGPAARGRIPAELLLDGARPADAGELVRRIDTVLSAALPPDKLDTIALAVEEQVGRVSEGNMQEAVYQAVRLVFGSPEFQMM